MLIRSRCGRIDPLFECLAGDTYAPADTNNRHLFACHKLEGLGSPNTKEARDFPTIDQQGRIQQ
jgi:hypothetical protein